MRWVLLLLTVAGCDRVFQLAELPGDAPTADSDAQVAPCFEDTFPAPAVDMIHWVEFEQGMTNLSVDGELAISLETTGAVAFSGIYDRNLQDLTGKIIEVEVAAFPSVSPAGSDTHMQLRTDENHYYQIGVDGNHFYVSMHNDTTDDVVDQGLLVPTDLERFWQFRSIGGSVEMWARSETKPWRLMHSFTAAIPLTAIGVEIASGTYTSVPSPGQARFDNFRIYCP